VVTVPHQLNVLALDNPRLFYDLISSISWPPPAERLAISFPQLQ
jgi:hypothetical protein